MAEGARLESVYTRKGIQGSNPCLSAIFSTTYGDLRSITLLLRSVTELPVSLLHCPLPHRLSHRGYLPDVRHQAVSHFLAIGAVAFQIACQQLLLAKNAQNEQPDKGQTCEKAINGAEQQRRTNER